MRAIFAIYKKKTTGVTMLLKKLTALLCAVCMAALMLPCTASADSGTERINEMKELVIDGKTADTAENSRWRGFGVVSANNSSRLLLDYKLEQPEVYDYLLKLMFDPEGPLKMTHLKLELGADINSSSGTEPATKRSSDESADVTRGAGFQLAADAKKINPDLTLELLSWGAPAYVNNAEPGEGMKLRYQWFKETLDAAYEKYGLKFDYIDPNYNERAVDDKWIKFFAKSLRAETDTPYDYGSIKILIADEECGFASARMMLSDSELMDAVDAVGVHYTSTSDETTKRVKTEYHKELFYSEGVAPCTAAKYAVNADDIGITGVNSILDVAGRIVNMYPNGGYTMYEFQPAIAAYYGGATYFPKQLIIANEPWSGCYEIGEGFYMAEHFSLFSEAGWQFVRSGCFGDGREEDHALYDTTDNYMTLTDPKTGDYSTVYVNNTASERRYSVKVTGLGKAGETVQVWETRGPDGGSEYDRNYLRNVMSITPEQTEGSYGYTLTVKPYSMVTVTTLGVTPEPPEQPNADSRLTLPYSDDFEYRDFSENYLPQRGCAPRYTTDIGGAFEVVTDERRGNVIEQKITHELRGREWGCTPEPVTTLGDDSWANYSVTADILLASGSADNYAGVAARYINSSAPQSRSGYSMVVFGDGRWELRHMTDLLDEGSVSDFDPDEWHTVSVLAEGDVISAAVDGVPLSSVTAEGAVTFSGRAALLSAYENNRFDNLEILPSELTGYVNRRDQLDSSVTFSGDWTHNISDSFTCHDRTSSETSGGSLEFSFTGDSLALIGTADSAVITVELDGSVIADAEQISGSAAKQAVWHRYSLGYGEHTAKITVSSGRLKLDALEYGSDSEFKDGRGGRLSELSEQPEEGIINRLRRRKNSSALLMCGAAAAVAAVGIAAVRRRRKKS